MQQKILVTGATGAQGGAVLNLLLQHQLPVRALVTSTEQAIPLQQKGIDTAIGNFNNPQSLAAAMDGITDVSLVYPLVYDWPLLRHYTQNLISVFQQSQVQHIVFNTSLALPPQKTGIQAADIKLEILESFQAAGLPITTLSPSFYLDNLTAPWSLPLIKEQGIISYPLPGDALFAWLSHENLARFTLSALQQPALIGQTFFIGGELLTGHQIADGFSSLLSKPVQYHYLPPTDFKAMLQQQYPEHIAAEIASLYQSIADNTQPLQSFYNPKQIEQVFKIQLQSFQEWGRKEGLGIGG